MPRLLYHHHHILFLLDFRYLSAQTIFSLLDCLTRWARLKADRNSKTQSINIRPEKADTLGMFLLLGFSQIQPQQNSLVSSKIGGAQ